MNITTLLKLAVFGLCPLAGLAAMPTAHAVSITWNGWTFDYEVGVNNEGLALKNVKYQTHALLKKISLPLINGGATGAIGSNNCAFFTDKFDGFLVSMPWANNATVSQRQFKEALNNLDF